MSTEPKNPLSPGRIWRHREKPSRQVRIDVVWEPEVQGESQGVAFDIWDPEERNYAEPWKTHSALRQPLFEQLYEYAPELNGEPRDLVLEASLALTTLSKGATRDGRGQEIGVLCDLMELVQAAEHFHAFGPFGLFCKLCGAKVVDEESRSPSVLALLTLMQTHTCAPEDLAKVRKAQEAQTPCEADDEEARNG